MNGCTYWVGSDTTGHRCNADTVTLGMCQKHHDIEKARAVKTLQKQQASHARAEAAWLNRNRHRVPAWRVQLEQAETEYARRTASPISDRAAVGGNTHRAITQQHTRHLSDTNITRVLELERIIQRLCTDLKRAGSA